MSPSIFLNKNYLAIAMFSLLPPSPPPKPPPKPASPKFFPPKPKSSKPSYPPKPYIPKPSPPMISPLDPYPVRPSTHPFRQFAFIVIGVAALLGAGSSYHSGRSAPITADPIPIPITFYPAIPPPAPARPEWKNPLIPIFVGIGRYTDIGVECFKMVSFIYTYIYARYTTCR